MDVLGLHADGIRTSAQVAEVSGRLWATVVASAPRVVASLVLIAAGVIVARGLRWSLRKVLLRSHTESFATVLSKVAGWIVVVASLLAGIAVAFPSVKPVDLLAGLGFFSVAIGFAFQDILENLLSGLLLLFRQPFQAGDQIEVDGREGVVLGITIRETRIQSYDGQLLIVPNRDVYKSAIRVQTAFPARRMSFLVGISYEADLDEAREIMRRAASIVEGVRTDPGPEALLTELGTSTVNVEVRFWTDPRQHQAKLTTDLVIAAVKRALDDAGIEMPVDIVALQGTASFQAAISGGTVSASGTVIRPEDGRSADEN